MKKMASITINAMNINFEYHDDIDIHVLHTPHKMSFLIQQLLGRFKRKKYIKIQCKNNTLTSLLNYLHCTKGITMNKQKSDIIIGRYNYPNGVMRDCEIKLANKYIHK